MKKHRSLFVFLFVFILVQNSYAQKTPKRAYPVFSVILKELEISAEKITIDKVLYNKDLKAFDFKRPRAHELNKAAGSVIDSADWRSFLSQVDTALIPNKATIDIKLLITDKKVLEFDIEKGSRQKLSLDNYGLIRFSSVIFSKDNNKAICIFKKISPRGEYFRTVFFLECNNDKWILVKNIVLTIS